MTTTDVPRCPVPPAGRTTWLRRSSLKKGKHTRKIDFPSFPIFTKSRRVHRTGGHSHANSTVETSSTSKVTLRHRPEKLMGDDPLARGRVRTPRHAPTAAGAPWLSGPTLPAPDEPGTARVPRGGRGVRRGASSTRGRTEQPGRRAEGTRPGRDEPPCAPMFAAPSQEPGAETAQASTDGQTETHEVGRPHTAVSLGRDGRLPQGRGLNPRRTQGPRGSPAGGACPEQARPQRQGSGEWSSGAGGRG